MYIIVMCRCDAVDCMHSIDSLRLIQSFAVVCTCSSHVHVTYACFTIPLSINTYVIIHIPVYVYACRIRSEERRVGKECGFGCLPDPRVRRRTYDKREAAL